MSRIIASITLLLSIIILGLSTPSLVSPASALQGNNLVYLPVVFGAVLDINGTWSGTLSQADTTFPFEMSLNQTGTSVAGTSTIRNNTAYATMSLTGTISGNTFQFQEVKIINTSGPPFPGGRWCIKSGTLTYTVVGSPLLRGPWSEPSCNSGQIVLQKQ